ncbi:MAG: hypothetical protein ACF8GE_12100 [Phycisphaerales bacterium JB043]
MPRSIPAILSTLLLGASAPAQTTPILDSPPAQPSVAPDGLVPEGTFLVQQFATMQRLGTNSWVMVFAPADDGRVLPPMILLPNTNLQAMEQITGPNEEPTGFLVSGQVLRFDDQNYLLVTIFTPASEPTDTLEANTEADIDDAPTPPPALSDDPSVEELLARMENETNIGWDETPPQATGTSPGLLTDGTLLALRRGRVMRSDSGGWRFIMDNDPDADPWTDLPQELLPCRALEHMRSRLELIGTDEFTISGRVFLYKGANYLLPVLWVQEHTGDSGLTTAQ